MKPLIYFEGKSDLIYIKKILDIMGKLDLLTEVELLSAGIERGDGNSVGAGSKNLKKIIDLLVNNPKLTNSVVMIVFDHDEKMNDRDERNLKVRSLRYNAENTIIENGIENLLPQYVWPENMNDFYHEIERKKNNGNIEIHKEFLKVKFAEYVTNSFDDLEVYRNLIPIINEIEQILTDSLK